MTITKTDGSSNTTETTDVGFVDLGIGDSVTIGGLTATATAPISAAAVATVFISRSGAGLTFSGELTGFTAAGVTNTSHVIFTSVTPNADVPDLFVKLNEHAPMIGSPAVSNIAITTQGSSGVSEVATVTFSDLAAGNSFSIGGFLVHANANANASAADVASIFSDITSNTTFPKTSGNLTLTRLSSQNSDHTYTTTGTVSSSSVTFISSISGNVPDLAVNWTGFDVSLTETQAITNTPTTGTFSISGVDSSDTITVEVEENVTASGKGTNAIALANLLNNRSDTGTSTRSYNNLIHSFKLGDDSGHVVVNNSTRTVAWSFDSSQHIPNFASLLTGESITLTYNVTAENSGEIAHKSVNFIIQGQTKIISAAVVSATQDIPGGAIQVETENGTHIRLIDSVSGADVTDKFDMMLPDLNAGIKTFTFQLKNSIGYNGTKTLVAQSFLDSDNSFTYSTLNVPSFTIPDGVEFYTGTDGSDTITGSSGADTLSGGMGNDTYVISDATNVVFETNIGGIDTIQSSVNFKLPRNVENLVLTGISGLIGNGNNLANHITGSSGSDTLDGGAGSDVMTGGAGDDVYVIDRLTDVVDESSNGGAGIDTINSFITYSLADTTHILGSVENLTLTGLSAIDGTGNTLPNKIVGNDAANSISGGDSADTLNGGNGNDTLVGGAGSDVLTGGAGVDTLTGGNSAGGTDTFVDTFKFDSITDMGIATRRDVITDFQTGTDKIDMYGTFTLTGSAGTLGTAPFTTTANQIRWSFYGNGTTNPYYAVVQGNTDTNPATVEFEIKLNGVTILAAGDFILV